MVEGRQQQLLNELQTENSRLRAQVKSAERAVAEAQSLARKEMDANASLRAQMSQLCSMNEHLRAENARLIQQQVSNACQPTSTLASDPSSSNMPFSSPTLVSTPFWTMVGMGNNNNAQQQQQQQPTSSTTTTPSCILPQHNNHNDNRNRQQQQVQIGAIDIVDQLLLGINSDSSGSLMTADSAIEGCGGTPRRSASAGGGGGRVVKQRECRYHCEWPGCQYATPYGGDLTKHRRKHTGERPYQCDQCNAAFGQQSSLSAHKYTHSDLRRFHCPSCEYSTNKCSDWTKHLKTAKHKKGL